MEIQHGAIDIPGFLSEVYAGDELEVEYSISDKKDGGFLNCMAYYQLILKLKG